MTRLRTTTSLGLLLVVFAGHTASASKGERWIATWATAQQLVVATAQGGPGGRTNVPPAAPGQGAPTPPAAAPQAPSPAPTTPAPAAAPAGPPRPAVGPPRAYLPPSFENQTVRMIVRSTVGGRKVRIALSNMLGADPLPIGAARIALHRGDGAVQPGDDKVLTFSGQASFSVLPGMLALSDAVALDVPPFTELAVSLYLPTATGAPTNHPVALQTAYIATGNHVASATLPAETTTTAYLWLSSVDVMASDDNAFTVVALGDSITDGFATTHGAHRAWPTLLAERLATQKRTRHVSVVNQGISGNQVLRNGAGLSMLARLDRDVFTRPGVRWLILLGGINDINFRGRQNTPLLDPEELIAGYRQIIERSHALGIKVVGATLGPEEGVPVATPQKEEIRQKVNAWIRTAGHFDAVVDFDAALRDPQRPARLLPAYDPGDFIHPNDAGNKAMADAFDLKIFTRD